MLRVHYDPISLPVRWQPNLETVAIVIWPSRHASLTVTVVVQVPGTDNIRTANSDAFPLVVLVHVYIVASLLHWQVLTPLLGRDFFPSFLS